MDIDDGESKMDIDEEVKHNSPPSSDRTHYQSINHLSNRNNGSHVSQSSRQSSIQPINKQSTGQLPIHPITITKSFADLSRAEQQSILTSIDPDSVWLQDENIDSSFISSSLANLRFSAVILLVGTMGAGKSTLLNALAGMNLFPTATSTETDTLCVIELVNDVFLKPGEFVVEIVLKDEDTLLADFDTYFGTLSDDHFASITEDNMSDSAEAVQSEIQIEYVPNTDLLRALHLQCYENSDAGVALRRDVCNYLEQSKNQESNIEAEGLELPNDNIIRTCLERRNRVLKFDDITEVRQLLDVLGRAHCDPDKSMLSNPKFMPIHDLLKVGEPWPLVQLITLSTNLTMKGLLPPFCRVLDSPGIGAATELTGTDVIQSIKRCICDRTITQVWYVNCSDRCSQNQTQIGSIGQLINFVQTIERVSFIYTKADRNPKFPQGFLSEARKIAINICKLLKDDKFLATKPTQKALIAQIHFVSAHVYAAYQEIDMGQDTNVLKERFSNVEMSNMLVAVDKLQRDVWDKVQHHYDVVRTFAQWTFNRGSDMSTRVDIEAAKNENTTVGSNVKMSEELAGQFVDSVSECIGDRCSEQLQRAADIACSKLMQLKKKGRTFNALLKNHGIFSSRTTTAIHIPDDIWKELQASADTTDLFQKFELFVNNETDTCAEVFRSFEQLVHESTNNQFPDCSHAAFVTVAIAHSVKRMSDTIFSMRQTYLTGMDSNGNALAELQAWMHIWEQLIVVKNNASKDKIQAAAQKLREFLRGSRFQSIVQLSVVRWARKFCDQLSIELDSGLRELCNALSNHRPVHNSTRAILLEHAREWLTKEQLCRKLDAQPKDRTFTPSSPDEHPSLWIPATISMGSKKSQKYYLLFRGLCGLDESDSDIFPIPPLLFPHQHVLHAIVPEVLTHSPTADQYHLADALAKSSAAAVLETALKSFESDSNSDSGISMSAVAQSCKDSGMLEALLPTLCTTGESIKRTMLRHDKEQNNTDGPGKELQTNWKKVNKRQPPELNRQEMYTNCTSVFLNGWRVYSQMMQSAPLTRLRRRKNAPHVSSQANDVPCPGDAVNTHLHFWFHWRWLSPRLFQLPHFSGKLFLHANPFVSSSQRMEHAIRYAAGFKHYRAAQVEGTVLSIEYDLKTYKALKPTLILGVVVVAAIKERYVHENTDHVRVILELLRDHKLSLKGGSRRIGAEAEVTVYGCLPADDSTILLRWPLLVPDLDNVNSVLREWYGIKTVADPMFQKLRKQAKTKCWADLRHTLAIACAKQLSSKLAAGLQVGDAKMNAVRLPPFDESVLNR